MDATERRRRARAAAALSCRAGKGEALIPTIGKGRHRADLAASAPDSVAQKRSRGLCNAGSHLRYSFGSVFCDGQRERAARRGQRHADPSDGCKPSIGLVCFLPLALVTGELFRLPQFPATAALWMAGYGVLHFLYGRYFNFHANAIAGVNLTAPVVQLQVVITMVLAVVALHEPCTALQMIGGALMLAGSLITQQAPARTAASTPLNPDTSSFKPRYAAGYLFASLAALAYGSSWVIPRFALGDTGPAAGVLGGLISYVAAIAVGALALLFPSVRRNVFSMKRENARWFAGSGVFVAAAQGLFFAAVTVAPIMLVIPLIQLSLAFRILFSTWLSPTHEVVGGLVLAVS
jgi:drug/metabolite transporter (DMT)-like permease